MLCSGMFSVAKPWAVLLGSSVAILFNMGDPGETQTPAQVPLWDQRDIAGGGLSWNLTKAIAPGGNNTRSSKYMKLYKLPSELFTNTQVLQAKSCKGLLEAERCCQHVHPAQFSSSEGFFLSLLLWKGPEEGALWPGHLQEGRQRYRGGGTGCDKRSYLPIAQHRSASSEKHIKAETLRIILFHF